MTRKLKKYTEEFRRKFIEDAQKSEMNIMEFCKAHDVSYSTYFVWVQNLKKNGITTKPQRGPYTPEHRRQTIEAYLKSGITQKDFAQTWGIPYKTLTGWLERYRKDGPKGLEEYAPPKADDKRKGRKISQQVMDEIVRIKNADPKSGLKYIKQVLSRFKGVNVSTGSIKKTLVEADIPLVVKERKRRRSSDKVRTFERALPMQLWQSDITSYLMTRHSQRVYLTVFMDDYSRYVVAWNLSVRQTTEFVSETLLEGVAKFGKPEEVLTDQGRQYFAWRGKSDFQRILDREGIRHVVSRSHHPQTLGKCERFWETVGQEFWERVKPQDLSDAKARFAHFINHYNHFRPHQGIDGLTPADRFFGLESEVRKVLEQTMTENQLRLAIGEAPRSPVFLVGQIGDQPISLHGEGGKLVLRTPEGETKELSYGEFGHLKKGEDNGRNEYGEADSEETWPEERDCIATEDTYSGEGDMGVSECRGEAESTQDSSDDIAVLDGTYDEETSGGGIEHSPTENLAALGSGSSGNGGWTIETTSDEERNEGNYEQGRRSEIPKEENCGAGEDCAFSESLDRRSEGDAGVYGCEYPTDGSKSGGDGEKVD